jgi:hypothetical protein
MRQVIKRFLNHLETEKNASLYLRGFVYHGFNKVDGWSGH